MDFDQIIIEAVKTSHSMAEAAAKAKLHPRTFKSHAQRLGVYKPNIGCKGSNKPKREGNGKYPLKDILDGKYPGYQTLKLKNRLYAEGLKNNKCEECGIDSWNSKKIECELDHINGDRTDHSLDNLKILCPNCHSQTSTFRFKKRN